MHQFLDYLFSICKLVQNKEVGWRMIDRKTGKHMREQQPLWWKLKLFLLFNPWTEWINNTQARRRRLRKKTLDFGVSERTPLSKTKIRNFVDFYHINMDDFDPANIEAYPTFEDFFTRKHKPGTRPIFAPDDPVTTASPIINLNQLFYRLGQS